MNAIATTKPRHTDVDSGALEKRTVRAGLTPKMIHAMITGMVKDKNAYPIREIGKNCHEVSPKGMPWRLRLPDYLSDMAVFRNFGPPLSHRFMMERYPKMGESTKDKDGVNGLSGLGLGSKSPFAKLLEDGQSGSYNVTAYDGGEARFYLISLTEGGEIQVKLMGRAPSTEHDGLEVSFAVPARDHEAFNEAAYEVLWGFEPQPDILPRPSQQWSNPRVRERGPDWTRYDGNSVPWTGVMVRVEKCIMYPVDLDQVEGAEGILSPNDHIVFEVDKDAVQATSSRESLQYTARTRDTLKGIVDRYADALIAAVQAEVAACETYFEASWALTDAKNGKTAQLKARMDAAVSWRGRRLDERFNWGWTKAMRFGAGWKAYEKFEARSQISARDMIGAKLVVQHGTDRTGERLEAHGLVGQSFFLLRMKRPALAEFLKTFAVPAGDIIVLESIKLPPRPKGDNAVKMRKLDVFTTSNRGTTEGRELVNINEPMPFVIRTKTRRRSNSEWDVCGRDVSEGQFDALMKVAIEAGVIEADELVACFRDEDAVPAGWDREDFDLGQHMVDGLKAFYDPAQTRSAQLGNWYNVDSAVQTMVDDDAFRGVVLPDDLAAVVDKARKLKDDGAPETAKGLHDTIKEALEGCSQLDKVVLPTLFKEVEREFFDLVDAKYMLLPRIVTNTRYTSTPSRHKRNLVHYFDLLTKAGVI